MFTCVHRHRARPPSILPAETALSCRTKRGLWAHNCGLPPESVLRFQWRPRSRAERKPPFRVTGFSQASSKKKRGFRPSVAHVGAVCEVGKAPGTTSSARCCNIVSSYHAVHSGLATTERIPPVGDVRPGRRLRRGVRTTPQAWSAWRRASRSVARLAIGWLRLAGMLRT